MVGMDTGLRLDIDGDPGKFEWDINGKKKSKTKAKAKRKSKKEI